MEGCQKNEELSQWREMKTLDTDRTVCSREACTTPLPRPGWITTNTFVWRYHCRDTSALDTDTLVNFVEKEEMDEADLTTREVVAVCQIKLNLSKDACLLVDHQVQIYSDCLEQVHCVICFSFNLTRIYFSSWDAWILSTKSRRFKIGIIPK